MYSFTPLISTLNRSLFTLHSSPFTPVLLYSSLFTLYSSLFTLYTLLFNLYSSSLFTIYRRLPSTFQSFSLHSSLFTHYPSPFSLYVFRFTFYAFTCYASLLAPCSLPLALYALPSSLYPLLNHYFSPFTCYSRTPLPLYPSFTPFAPHFSRYTCYLLLPHVTSCYFPATLLPPLFTPFYHVLPFLLLLYLLYAFTPLSS